MHEVKILEPSDARWRELFDVLPLERQDVFYTPEYAELAARHLHKNGRAHCAVLESGSAFVLYPFLRRELRALLANTGVDASGSDLHGPYGRNGPIASGDDPDLLARFHASFDAYCATERIVCGFDRFHPVLENQRWASPRTRLIDVGGFVVVDLRPPVEEIESRFKHAARKNIKKAVRAGVQVFSEASLDHLEQFLSIYSHTMQRHDARAFYYAESSFYRAIAERLPKSFRFFYATLNGVPVSCELVLLHGHYCHSFLGGTLKESMDSCPNHLLKRDIIRYAREAGCRHYLLGGGETANNGIWNYKMTFAPEGNRPSVMGGTVFDAAAYAALREELLRKGVSFPDGRFQFYDRQ